VADINMLGEIERIIIQQRICLKIISRLSLTIQPCRKNNLVYDSPSISLTYINFDTSLPDIPDGMDLAGCDR